MKILLATGIFPPQIGGPATYSKLLYDELPKRGIDVEIATFGDYIDRPKLVRHYLYFRELLRKAPDADLIYALDPVSVGLPALLASQIRGKKMVLRVAGDYAWEQGTQRFGVLDSLDDFAKNSHGYSFGVKVLKKIQAYVAEGALRIVTPSKYLKSVIVDWGIDPRKIDVVYNGFRVEQPRSLKPTLRKKLGLTGSVIVTAGRLVPWKGVKELIEALPLVLERIPDARLVVIGDGPEHALLKKTAEERRVSDKVSFVGRLSQKDLFEYIKAADVFALNTRYEGQSHLILETMAIGTPVVTTNVGGNPETIVNGASGMLLQPNDIKGFAQSLVLILSERAIAFTLSRNAKKTVSNFTDEKMLDTIAEELKSLFR